MAASSGGSAGQTTFYAFGSSTRVDAQTTLTDYEHLLDEIDVDARSTWDPMKDKDLVTCQNCGNKVSRQYVRVFGEANDRLQHCYACKSRTQRY